MGQNIASLVGGGESGAKASPLPATPAAAATRCQLIQPLPSHNLLQRVHLLRRQVRQRFDQRGMQHVLRASALRPTCTLGFGVYGLGFRV